MKIIASFFVPVKGGSLRSTHNSSGGPAARHGGETCEDTSRSGRGLRPLHPHLGREEALRTRAKKGRQGSSPPAPPFRSRCQFIMEDKPGIPEQTVRK